MILDPKPRTAAMTRTEVLVVVAVLLVLFAGFAVLWLPSAHDRARQTQCAKNLKMIGLAFKIWIGDCGDKYTTQVSALHGGSMELVATGNVAAVFQSMSNELNATKTIFCPADNHAVWTTNWGDLQNKNVSYFVDPDGSDLNPQSFISGDDNFALSGVPVKPGVLEILTNTPIAWTNERHKFCGNVLFSDGEVKPLNTADLSNALTETGETITKFAVP